MKISDIVANKINHYKRGYVFTYDNFNISVENISALKMALNRMVTAGRIIRLSKGQFYRPEITDSGILQPPEFQIVKDLFKDGNKIIGYQTGVSIWNKLGLTTHISNIIQIGTNFNWKPKKRGKFNIRFIRQKNTIYKHNIYLLQILDSIRLIKKIPDSDITKSCLRIIALIKDISDTDRISIAKLALKYNPGTRALTGAILDHVTDTGTTEQLLDSLNPVSVFRFDISDDVLTNKLKWRIS